MPENKRLVGSIRIQTLQKFKRKSNFETPNTSTLKPIKSILKKSKTAVEADDLQHCLDEFSRLCLFSTWKRVHWPTDNYICEYRYFKIVKGERIFVGRTKYPDDETDIDENDNNEKDNYQEVKEPKASEVTRCSKFMRRMRKWFFSIGGKKGLREVEREYPLVDFSNSSSLELEKMGKICIVDKA